MLLDRGAVKMRPLEIFRRDERFAETLEVIGETHVARLHRHLDAIAIGRAEPRLRIVGQMQDFQLELQALRDVGQLPAIVRDECFRQQYPGHAALPPTP